MKLPTNHIRTALALLAFLCIPFVGAVLMMFSIAAWAQPAIPVSTGSKTGSYYAFMDQATKICPTPGGFELLESAGSTQNIDRAEANEVSLFISQLDILDLYKRTKDMSNVKLLVPLFPEQVHFVTRSDVTNKQGGFGIGGMTFGGKEVQLKNVADLAGKRVVAAGGSYRTAQVIALIGGISWNLQEVPGADQAITAVVSGQADAAVMVGAQPLGTLTAMKDKMATLRLLPVPDELVAKLSSVYTKAFPLNYRQMGAGGDNVQTVQVMSALMTQNYPKSAIGDAIANFRACLLQKAPDQATIPRTHPAWRNLRTNQGVNWEVWNYPLATSVAPAAPARK